MTFIAPLAFALAALAAPIVVMYMLRSRRARKPVSSTMLWDVGQRNVSASAPWQPLRFSWLLLLQLLALLLVVLAVARPARPTSVPLADHTVLILDTSASMQAGDQGRSRLESAKRAALRSVDQLAPGKLMSVVDAGPRARVVITGSSDRRSLVEAISSLRATDGSTDAGGAFALGQSLEEPDTPTILHYYSDGGVRTEDRAIAPGILTHMPVGAAAGNVAVSRVSVAPRGGGWDAFVRLVNAGTLAADASLVLEADGQRVDVLPVRLDPQSARDVTLAIPRTTATRITARLENVRPGPDVPSDVARDDLNALSVDDRAYAVLDRGGAMRVLLVTPGNVFLESLLKSIPGAVVTTSAKAIPTRAYTLVIYDRVDPPAKIDAPALVIAAPRGAPGVAVRGSVTRPVVSFVQPRDDVVSHVDLSRLAIRSAQKISAPEARTLVAAGDDPLLTVGVPGGRRLAYLAFDLRESNLPVQVAFPLLLGNLTTWLTQGEGRNRTTLVAGDALPLRVPGHADRLVVDTPGGASVTRDAARAAFDETERAGFYRVRYFTGSDQIGEETFAINVPPLESSLTPRPITGKLAARNAGGARLTGVRAIGPGILALVLVVLLLEWWVAHGRPRLRQRRATA